MANTIQASLNAYVKASTAVVDQIGSRFYYLQAPDGSTTPYAVFVDVDDPHAPHSFDKTDAGQIREQINVYSTSRYAVLDAADAIRDRLDQYTGTMSSMDVEMVMCSGIILIPQPDEERFQASFDAMVTYYE